MIQLSEYDQRELDKKLTTVKDLNSFGNYKWDLVGLDDHEGVYSIELVSIYPIVCRYDDYGKKYNFWLDIRGLKYIDYNNEKGYKENNPEPKQVGVLNAKKINDWVGYLIKMYEYLKIMSVEKVLKAEIFLKDIEKLNQTAGAEVYLSKEKEYQTFNPSGSVELNGIRYEWSIADNGYISQNIELRYYPAPTTIKTFLELADNKLTKEIKL